MITNLLRAPNSWSFLVDLASYSLVATLLTFVVLARPVLWFRQARPTKADLVNFAAGRPAWDMWRQMSGDAT